MASALEAHIAGIAYVYDVNIPMSELGYNPGGINGTEEYSDASLTAGCGAENRGGAQVAEGALLIRIESDA